MLLPGHDKNSTNVFQDIDLGIERLERLLQESREIFNLLNDSRQGFDSIVRSLRDLNVK